MANYSKQLERTKGRKLGGKVIVMHFALLEHPNYIRLSSSAKALLLDLKMQYNLANNGNLSCCHKLMQPRGWKSRTTIEKARAELEQTGWIVRTQQGSLNRPNLYALTFHEINECRGKPDIT